MNLYSQDKGRFPKDETGSEAFFHETPKELYHKEYFSVLDLVINYIKDRFQQPGYGEYKHLQELLLKAACGDSEDYASELQFVTTFYGDDMNSSVLQVQLELCNTYLNLKEFNNNGSFTVLEIRDCFCKLSPAARASMSEVVTILKLLMVMPATNAVSERSVSALR